MKLFAARHGETTWNVEGRILGSTPGELTERGEEQARFLAERVKELKPDAVYASDLARVVATARIVEQGCLGLKAEFTEQLRERNFGELEGELFSEVDWDGFWALPEDESQYNAESLNDFTLRIAGFVTELHKRHPDKTVLLLAHIGVMNRLSYLTDPAHFEFVKYPNAEAMEFDSEKILQNSAELFR